MQEASFLQPTSRTGGQGLPGQGWVLLGRQTEIETELWAHMVWRGSMAAAGLGQGAGFQATPLGIRALAATWPVWCAGPGPLKQASGFL